MPTPLVILPPTLLLLLFFNPDAILKTAFESSECKEMGLVSFLLIHMGLLKVREPQERMTFLSSLLRLRLFKDSYLRKTKFSDITTLGSLRSYDGCFNQNVTLK